MNLKTRHGHRARLLIAMGASWIMLAALVAYAFSLEEWGEARTIAFTIIGFTVVGVNLSAMVLLLVGLAQSRHPEQ